MRAQFARDPGKRASPYQLLWHVGVRDEGNGRAGSCHRFLDHVSEKGCWIDAKRAALDCLSARPRATMAEPIVIDPAPACGDPNACLCAMRQTRVRRFGSAVVILRERMAELSCAAHFSLMA